VKVVIVDYGMGNIESVKGALKYLGVDKIILSNKLEDIRSADKLILPGVGSFPSAMKNIKNFALIEPLKAEVNDFKKPILGICLGMQLMCKSSNEGIKTEGLGFIDGDVEGFLDTKLNTLHVGFDQVKKNDNSRLLHNLDETADFYFVHSYKVLSNSDIGQSMCDYGGDFIACYEKDNIAGVQFHPELSQSNGMKLISNFIEYF